MGWSGGGRGVLPENIFLEMSVCGETKRVLTELEIVLDNLFTNNRITL